MNKFLFLIIFCFSSLLKAQSIDVGLLEQIPNAKDITFFSRDHLGDTYLIQNNQLVKTIDNKSFYYSNLLYGEISSIDIRNPLFILIFYKEFQSFVVLDNQLNVIQNIRLNLGYPEFDVFCVNASTKNNFWVFDEISMRLYLFDIAKNEMKTISNPFDKTMRYWNSNLNAFFFVQDKELIAYDIYGKRSSVKITEPFDAISLLDANVYLMQKGNELFLNDLKHQLSYKINLPQKSFNSFSFSSEILSIFTDSEIYIYKLKLP